MAVLMRAPPGKAGLRRSLPEGRNGRGPGKARRILCVLWVMAMGSGFGTLEATAAELASEYQVKAAYLVNLPKYVNWPAGAFAETNSPVVLTVVGESKVADEIPMIIEGRIVNGRRIILKRVASGDAPREGHILFVPAAEQKRSPGLLSKLRDTGILTVGESDDFLERGGIINLVRRDQHITLEVNVTAADKAQITLSSKLLGVSKVEKGNPK